MSLIRNCSYFFAVFNAMFSPPGRIAGINPSTLVFEGGRIRYYRLAPEKAELSLIFVHGAPGHAGAFENQFDIPFSNAVLVAFDRPGYGESTARNEASMEVQVQALVAMANREVVRPRIVVAHSYGALVAIRTIEKNPGLIDGLLLIAPAVDPNLNKPEPYLYLMNRMSRILPRAMRSMTGELLSVDLSWVTQALTHLQIPVVTLHGANDSLVPIDNSQFVEKLLKNTKSQGTFHQIPEGGHFLQIQEPLRINSGVAEVFSRTRSD